MLSKFLVSQLRQQPNLNQNFRFLTCSLLFLLLLPIKYMIIASLHDLMQWILEAEPFLGSFFPYGFLFLPMQERLIIMSLLYVYFLQ